MANDYFDRISSQDGKIAKIIAVAYPELPYNFLMQLLRKKDVSVNGKKVKDCDVKKGDSISIYLKPNAVPLKVVYKDNNLLAAYKPKGLISDGDRSFESLVKYVYPTSVLLHRLDTNTDGLLLFALNDNAFAILSNAMKNHEIIKEYRATVFGEVLFDNRKIKGYLVKDEQKGRVKVFDEPVKDSEPVEIIANTLSIKDGTSILKIILKGGKTHQIRAQLAHEGYFIIGDGKYGDDKINRSYNKKSQELTAVAVSFAISNDTLGLNGLTIKLDE